VLLFALAENSIQLVPDGTLLLHLLLIVIMIALLNLTLFRPINKVLEERESMTAGRLSEAQAKRAKVRESLAEYERRLREARTEGYRLMELERLAALKEREGKIASVKQEIGNWVAEEKTNLARQSENVQATLKGEAQKIALEIGSQILQRPLSGSTDLDIA
jgi:F-type H+-transporting ATPase subunit b